MGRYLRAMARTGQPPGTSRKGCGLLAAPLPCQDLQAAPVGRYLRATPQAIRTDRASLPGVRATDRSPGQRWTRARDASRPSHVRTRPAISPELRAEMIFAHRRDQASDQRPTPPLVRCCVQKQAAATEQQQDEQQGPANATPQQPNSLGMAPGAGHPTPGAGLAARVAALAGLALCRALCPARAGPGPGPGPRCQDRASPSRCGLSNLQVDRRALSGA